MKPALFAYALGMTTGAVMGTTPTSAYIESSAGVATGGRTGFTAVVVGVLLLGTLFLHRLSVPSPPFRPLLRRH